MTLHVAWWKVRKVLRETLFFLNAARFHTLGSSLYRCERPNIWTSTAVWLLDTNSAFKRENIQNLSMWRQMTHSWDVCWGRNERSRDVWSCWESSARIFTHVLFPALRFPKTLHGKDTKAQLHNFRCPILRFPMKLCRLPGNISVFYWTLPICPLPSSVDGTNAIFFSLSLHWISHIGLWKFPHILTFVDYETS